MHTGVEDHSIGRSKFLGEKNEKYIVRYDFVCLISKHRKLLSMFDEHLSSDYGKQN